MGKKLLQKAGAVGLPPSPAAGVPGAAPSPAPSTPSPLAGMAGRRSDAVGPDGGGGVEVAGDGSVPRDGHGGSSAEGQGASGGAGSGSGSGPVTGFGAGWQGLPGLASVPGTAGVGGSAAPGSPATSGLPAPSVRAKTAPGTMLGFMTAQSAAVQEAEQLRQRLAGFEGALPARLLDPALVQPSRWANRHERSFDEPAFAALRAEVAAAGGNVQAIKVRPVAVPRQGVGPSNPPAPIPQARYEIVYGHRRHRACLELGLPVLAIVDELSEQQLFIEMERENRQRKDLSAWEQGMMYARALDQGLYPSNRQLALAIGRDLGDIGKALALARLPQPVVDAFASPLDLQFRWAKLLSEAQQQDPEALLARAQRIKALPQRPSAKRVLELLLSPGMLGAVESGASADLSGQPTDPTAGQAAGDVANDGAAGSIAERGKLGAGMGTGSAWRLDRDGRTVATASVDSRGRTHVRIELPLDEARRRKLHKLLNSLLG